MAIYLLANGAVAEGVFVIVSGVAIIGMADNILRPALVGKDTGIPDWIILVTTLGGIATMGLSGVVLGPLLAGLFIAGWGIAQEYLLDHQPKTQEVKDENSQAAPGSQAEQVGRLIIAGILIVFAPALPFGQYFIYPFTILSTWFHEMGHGFTAMIFGYDFEQLIIFPNGSGLAESRVPANASNFSRIVIAAGGPLWPCLMGSLLILASSEEKFGDYLSLHWLS